MSQIRHLPLLALLALTACRADAAVGSGFGVSTTTGQSTTTGESTMPGTSAEPAASSGDAGSSGTSGGMSASGTSSSSSPPGASTTTGDTSTGSPPGYCGDGVVDPATEECEDGNDDPADGCYACLHARKVFVTSMMFTPNLGGLTGADSRCKQLANKAGLARWETYHAWLSDSKQDARDRVFVGKGPLVRIDGVVVVDQGAALLQGHLNVPISINEYGATVAGDVWTGTRVDGKALAGSNHCADWTTKDYFGNTAYYGISNLTDSGWTYYQQQQTNPALCDAQLRLYCIEGP